MVTVRQQPFTDTFTVCELGSHGADMQGEAGAFAAGFETDDSASGFDETGKHAVV
jgi:hypothetical protein